MADTVKSLLRAPADAPAILAPDSPALSHGALRAHVERTVARLNELGIGRNDRVAIVLPNGPEMASAFVAIAAGATTAPLNPAYRDEEFEFYLSDLGAKALVLEAGADSPASAVAERLGVPILRLEARRDEGAGLFDLLGDAGGAPEAGGMAEPDDIALVLHTSGTTSRPKIVPLAQTNICATARHIGETLALSPADRCLNIMPLFHIHGLMSAVLSSLAAGGSVFCSPGFNALKFFSWMEEAGPSWYTAVPTMHQAILSRAARNQETVDKAKLRFIRSSSSSLAPQVMAELEKVFGAPVIESYGMTEAAHQMTSNPLPPRERKPGSVGVAAGPEVAIMGPDGGFLPAGTEGEVVIRGPNVTKGYENNPEANAGAFTEGWFHTGDNGVMDEAGYLSITGRIKEIINRGGEKISPREVDEILMDHPAVAQAVTFAMPHDKLGEEVACAIVLREGSTAEEREIRDFAATRLADFKVPRKVLFLEEIPKGATGKLQRIGLAKQLGLAPVKICVFGAGAIGGYLGVQLALAGQEVSLIARGPHLAAMKDKGLTLRIEGEERVARPLCTDDPAEAGVQDFVVIGLKAHSVPGVVEAMQPLLGPDTAIVSAVNGVPWWYFHELGGPHDGARLEAVDPGDVQWNGLGPELMIGCVVYPACEVVEPGVIEHIDGDRFTLGEPSGEKTERIARISGAMIEAGLKAPVRPNIRDEIWVKLWGNLAFNPLSALTHGTLEVIAGDPGTRAVAKAMMLEAKAVGEALGVRFRIDVEKRIDGAGAVGAHKTSMLQDLERGRPMEIDAIVTAVQEMGRLVGVETPTIDTILALVRQRARIAGCYAG